MPKTPESGRDWVVKVRVVVQKSVYVRGCSKEQARAAPWEFAYDETEDHQEDWTVLSVEPNT